jgi:hypothetical protein
LVAVTAAQVASHMWDRGAHTTVVDQYVAVDDADAEDRRAANHQHLRHVEADLDGDWTTTVGSTRFDTVFVLDVLEHMKSPERTPEQIFSVIPIFSAIGSKLARPLRLPDPDRGHPT